MNLNISYYIKRVWLKSCSSVHPLGLLSKRHRLIELSNRTVFGRYVASKRKKTIGCQIIFARGINYLQVKENGRIYSLVPFECHISSKSHIKKSPNQIFRRHIVLIYIVLDLKNRLKLHFNCTAIMFVYISNSNPCWSKISSY